MFIRLSCALMVVINALVTKIILARGETTACIDARDHAGSWLKMMMRVELLLPTANRDRSIPDDRLYWSSWSPRCIGRAKIPCSHAFRSRVYWDWRAPYVASESGISLLFPPSVRLSTIPSLNLFFISILLQCFRKKTSFLKLFLIWIPVTTWHCC